VPKKVRIDIAIDPGKLGSLFHDLPDPRGGELLSPLGEKDLTSRVATYQLRALAIEISF
jgi:hypothetical protein